MPDMVFDICVKFFGSIIYGVITSYSIHYTKLYEVISVGANALSIPPGEYDRKVETQRN